MSDKICSVCGFHADSSVNFCPNCGKALDSRPEKESLFDLEGVEEFKNNTRFQKMYQSLSPEEAGEQLYPRELFNFGFSVSVILRIIGVVAFIICLVIAMPLSGLDRGLELRQALPALCVGASILVVCFLLAYVIKLIGKLVGRSRDGKKK